MNNYSQLIQRARKKLMHSKLNMMSSLYLSCVAIDIMFIYIKI